MAVGAQLANAESPRVSFIEPKDGAVVINPFSVKFGLEGMALKPAADPTPNSGHHQGAGPERRGDREQRNVAPFRQGRPKRS
jgi:hypothetical protein